jgi:hypothetical protein
MRLLNTSLLVALSTIVLGCSDLGEPTNDDLVDFTGTIVQDSPQTFLIETDVAYQNLKTFYPLNLETEFRTDGLRVRFSGKIEVESYVDYIWPNIRLSTMTKIPLECATPSNQMSDDPHQGGKEGGSRLPTR